MQSSALLLAATQRALQQAVIGLVYCKREGRQCAPHLQAPNRVVEKVGCAAQHPRSTP